MSTLEAISPVPAAPIPTDTVLTEGVSTDAAPSLAAATGPILSAVAEAVAVPAVATPWEGMRARVRNFFHSTEVPYGLALMRILICFTLLWVMVPRWYFARELFSTDGAPITMWESYQTRALVPDPNGPVAVAITSIVILTLITSCIGWCTRLSLTVCTTGYIYLNMLDIIATTNKYTVLAAHLLFLLCFSHCGAIWSIDNWLRRSRLRRQGVPPELADQPLQYSAAARRALQIFVAAVYIGAATTKLRIPAYFTGEQLQTWMITDYNLPNFLGSRFAMHPALLVAFGYIGLAWETLFIFLCWRGIGRIAMLSLGFIFHFMTWLTLGLWVFPLVCWSSYFAFMNENDVAWFGSIFARWRERGRGPRAAVGRLFKGPNLATLPAIKPEWNYGAFAALAIVTAVGGIGAEYKLDRYGVRRPEGMYPLKELDSKQVADMLGPTARIRNEDKVLLFDVGSILVGGALLDRRTEFRQGETVRVECDLCPPHEDMWIECNLHDHEDRVVDTIGVFVSADEMRAMYYYNLGECTMPGDYSLVLKIAGEEIMRRPLKVLPRTTACLAN
jgi:hypothetical protein